MLLSFAFTCELTQRYQGFSVSLHSSIISNELLGCDVHIVPWHLWIANAQARVKESCCLSCTVFPMLTVAIIGGTGTQHGMFVIDGPECLSNLTITTIGNKGG